MAKIGIMHSVVFPCMHSDTTWTLDIKLMIDSPSRISRQVRSEMARRRFSLEDGLRRVSNKESMAILSDTNLALLRNIKDTNEGSDANLLELIETLIHLLAGVVCVQ